MDPYDSDSSLADDEDFTETGTLLGYASPEIIDDTISHLGGWPVRLDTHPQMTHQTNLLACYGLFANHCETRRHGSTNLPRPPVISPTAKSAVVR